MSKCTWLKKLLGLNKESHEQVNNPIEDVSKTPENNTESVMSENVEDTEIKTEETPTETPTETPIQ
jgi:hypothetical protein